ncbi:P-loop containing nucleoside triphosphate hydrolase protein, partial [Pisolithus marmoratus]
NIVLLGESGVGKSSIINMISGAQIAKTSNNVLGDGSRVACYVVEGSGLRINFWETMGFAGKVGSAPSWTLRDLKALVRRLLVFRSINLLILCMSARGITNTVVQGYHAIYVEVCAQKVPIALVINGLEGRNSLDMHRWWIKNKDTIFHHGLTFDIHACVMTL